MKFNMKELAGIIIVHCQKTRDGVAEFARIQDRTLRVGGRTSRTFASSATCQHLFYSAIVAISLLPILITPGCATTTYRFADAEPVSRQDDSRPIPVPKSTEYEKFDYIFSSLVRRPAVKAFEVSLVQRSKDVNSMDEIPVSSWYTPRLGYKDISPAQLLKGPFKVGPPQPPITVVKAKYGGANPGFIVADVRGKLYLIKFDPPEFPAVETTTALIVNRLFWGFGYNVPEDFLFYFRSNDIRVDAEGELTQTDVDEVLKRVAPPIDGIYRSTASLLIDGIILGPILDRGVRKDDLNDNIRHEDRRVLRAMRVFGAFTNHTDIRIDNMLDVYVGEKERGYVKHYLIDFGEAFGGHGAEHDYRWDGFHHYFEWGGMFKNLVTLGFDIEDWENIEYTPWQSVGAFESVVFQPKAWKEVYPFEPIQRSQPDDDYWAAKILGALTDDHIKTLVEAADYPEPEATKYIIQTLIERRRKVVAYFMNQVTSVESLGLHNGQLYLQDIGKVFSKTTADISRYEISFYNDAGKAVAPKTTLTANDAKFSIAIPDSLINAADGYLRVGVLGEGKPRIVQFHVRSQKDGSPRLVGVVR